MLAYTLIFLAGAVAAGLGVWLVLHYRVAATAAEVRADDYERAEELEQRENDKEPDERLDTWRENFGDKP